MLLPVVTGVARTGQLQTALRELQDVAAGQLKDAVRQLLDHVLAQGGGSGGAAGAEQLQMLPVREGVWTAGGCWLQRTAVCSVYA